MKKTLKISLGIFCGFSILAGVFYASKENPRVYLSDRINVAYINEEVDHKNFENVINLLIKANFNIDDKVKKALSYVKGFYMVSDSSFISNRKACVGIVDFGYLYPLITLKVETYFNKVNDFYILKDEYQKKYLDGEKIYLKIEKGNFLLGKREKDIERILKNEKYFNSNLLNILDKEKGNNLGMLILNLGKNPLGGFDEFVLTGDVNAKEEMTLTANIGGKNDIIKSFNGISQDGLAGDRVIERNKIYLRSTRDAELRSFLFFLNYFFKNSFIEGISSNVYINNPKNDGKLTMLSKDDVVNINVEDKQFISGDIDVKIKDKIIGTAVLKGIAEEDRLKISTILSEETTLNLLKVVK